MPRQKSAAENFNHHLEESQVFPWFFFSMFLAEVPKNSPESLNKNRTRQASAMLSAGDFARSLWAICIKCQELSTSWMVLDEWVLFWLGGWLVGGGFVLTHGFLGGRR